MAPSPRPSSCSSRRGWGSWAAWAGSACLVCSLPDVYSPAVENLITQLARLPGIGRRTAQRLAFFILRSTPHQALALADALREVKEKIGFCEECFNLAEGPLCSICADARRDRTVICVVEDPSDVVAVERTHEYRGVYHVLGGALSPIDGVDPEHLRIADRLRGRGRVTRLASGLPVGGDLEYADEVTLGRAFSGRREM